MNTDIGARATSAVRTWLGIFGLLAVIAGVIILVWPGKSAVAIAGLGAVIFALYAIVGGIAYFATGIFSTGLSAGMRFWRIILGALAVVAGVIALFNLSTMAVFFALFITIVIGLTWITEGVVAFASLGSVSSKGWTVFFGIISILAGGLILFSPLYGFLALWWVFGISAVVYGVMQMVAAFSINS